MTAFWNADVNPVDAHWDTATNWWHNSGATQVQIAVRRRSGSGTNISGFYTWGGANYAGPGGAQLVIDGSNNDWQLSSGGSFRIDGPPSGGDLTSDPSGDYVGNDDAGPATYRIDICTDPYGGGTNPNNTGDDVEMLGTTAPDSDPATAANIHSLDCSNLKAGWTFGGSNEFAFSSGTTINCNSAGYDMSWLGSADNNNSWIFGHNGGVQSGAVVTSATFNNFSSNNGTINGDAVFNDSAINANGAQINGAATFNVTSQNQGYANGNCTFNDASQNANAGQAGPSVFNNTSVNAGQVATAATFNDASSQAGTGFVNGTMIITAGNTATQQGSCVTVVFSKGAVFNTFSATTVTPVVNGLTLNNVGGINGTYTPETGINGSSILGFPL